ncbi:MAG: class I SAM-dependent methyltransferase, partial [Acidobacteria bacterium]|nr:class I SAM-dependent methyltransferase [Acidobacteriota bacterium]
MTQEPEHPFPPRLVCPRCRKPEDGKLIVSLLEPVSESGGAPIGDYCPLCRTSFERVDHIPCVPYDPEYFRSSQASAFACDWACPDLRGAQAACRVAGQLDAGSQAFYEITYLTQHALAHFPGAAQPFGGELDGNRILLQTVVQWLQRHRDAAMGDRAQALDAGCGPGAVLHALAPLFPGGVAGMDWRIGVLRLARRVALGREVFLPFCVEGRRFEPVRIAAPAPASDAICFVQGDIHAPPLEAEAFSVVSALSFLDAVADPIFALGQLDALLAPGGLLVIGTP